MKMKRAQQRAAEEEGERIIVVGRVGEGVGANETKERGGGEGHAKGAHKYKCFRSCGIEIKTRRRKSTRRRRRRRSKMK